MAFKILVVDDEPSIRELICRHLEKKGYEVFTATDGREAIFVLPEVKPDLMILDIRMPEMDGLEVLQKLRDAHKDTLIMVLTAYDDLWKQAESLGCCDYITKPFELDYLETRIATNLMLKSAPKASVPKAVAPQSKIVP